MKYTIEDAELIVDLAHEDFTEEVAHIRGAEHRWTRKMKTIFKHKDGSYWAVNWERGLTELQDSVFNSAPYRVEPINVRVPATSRIEWKAV